MEKGKNSTSPSEAVRGSASSGRVSGKIKYEELKIDRNSKSLDAFKAPRNPAFKPAAPAGSTTGSGDSGTGGSNPREESTTVNQGTKVTAEVKQPAPQPVEKIEENETKNDKSEDKSINEMTLDELEAYKRDHVLSVEEAEEIATRAKEIEEAQRKSDGKGDEAGKIEKTDDPDDEKDNDDKFDIQQGDFIEFLMKDVVLAGAAWGGKKISNYVGLYTYKGLSWAYHGTKDELLSPAWNATTDYMEEKWKAAKANVKEAFRTPEEYEIKDTLRREDATTGYAHKIIAEHNQVIKDVKETFNPEVYKRFADAVIAGNLEKKTQNGKLVWQDKETLACIPIESEFMKHIIERTQKATKDIDEQIKDKPEFADRKTELLGQISQSVAQIAQDNTLFDAPEKTFVSNMVTAQLLRQRAETPDKEPTAEEVKALEAKMSVVYISEWIKIQRGESEFKDVKEFLEASNKAMKTSYNDIADGRYAERGKIPPTNETLEHLTNLNAKQIKEKGAKTLHEEATSYLTSISKMEAALAAAHNTVAGYEAQQEEVNQRRERVNETKQRINNNRDKANEDKTTNGNGNKNKQPLPRMGESGGRP